MSTRTVILRDRFGYDAHVDVEEPLCTWIFRETKLYVREEGVLYVERNYHEIHDTRRSFRLEP